jgi:hypothetical protein
VLRRTAAYPQGPTRQQDTEDQVVAIWQPSRFWSKPMKVAMLLNDDSGNRDF